MISPSAVLSDILYNFIKEINDKLFCYREIVKENGSKRYPAWHNNVVRESKVKEKEKVYNKGKEYCWDDKRIDDTEKERQRKETFDAWLQYKIKQEKEMKRKQKRVEAMVGKLKKNKEIVQSQLRTITNEEWLKKKCAQEKEELERKRREKEREELEKKKKEMVSKIKVNQWMKESNKRLRRPVDQSLYSAKDGHIGFVNPEPWRSIIEDL